jgi:hypothetical protein
MRSSPLFQVTARKPATASSASIFTGTLATRCLKETRFMRRSMVPSFTNWPRLNVQRRGTRDQSYARSQKAELSSRTAVFKSPNSRGDMVHRFMGIKRNGFHHVTPGDTSKSPAPLVRGRHSGINAHNVLITSIARMRQQNASAKPALDRIGLGKPMTSNFGVFFQQ